MPKWRDKWLSSLSLSPTTLLSWGLGQSKCSVAGSEEKKCSVKDGASELLNEPLLGVFPGDALELAEDGLARSALGNTLSGAGEDDVEVHSKDTGGGVVLDSKINVFVDTEAEVSCYNK